MNHANNERLALNLRALADRIEKSPHEYSASFSTYGGDPIAVEAGIPVEFGPLGYALILGDKDFVSARQVVCVGSTGN